MVCDALKITPEQLLAGKEIDIGIYTKDFENEYILLTMENYNAILIEQWKPQISQYQSVGGFGTSRR